MNDFAKTHIPAITNPSLNHKPMKECKSARTHYRSVIAVEGKAEVTKPAVESDLTYSREEEKL